MKKKLLFVNGHLNVGGVENSLLNVLKNINYHDYEIDLILFEELGDYANEVPPEVNIIYFDLSKTYGPIKQCLLNNVKNKNWFALALRSLFMLDKLIGAKSLTLAKPLFKLDKYYDCAIAYRVGICTDFVGYVINSNKKVTWWHHGEFHYPESITKRWVKVYKKFHHVIAVSNSTKKMLIHHIRGIAEKTITIPNMINVDEIHQKANDTMNTKIHFTDTLTLVSVGRLSPEKGMIHCVHTCKRLVEDGYNVKWYLIGEGVQRDEIESCIKENQLENHIFLLGAIANPYPYMKNAYIYVHPSLVESLSITVLEALALNTPVVVARSMGPEEFIRDKENGLLVEPTPDGLFTGIVSLIKDHRLYTRLKMDKSDVLNDYCSDVIMTKINDLIEAG